MGSGMPELGSKISLISKADIRYEGRLFTVDPQECTIALASVRSFGTEDRETQYPVAPQSQVYDYILFRGADIKDIRVLNNVPSLPNDPAIMQMSVPPSLGGGSASQFTGQFSHPIVGQTQYPQYHPMAGFPGSVHPPLNKTSSMLDLIGGTSQQSASRSTTPAVGGHRKSPTADQSTQVGSAGGSSSGGGGGQQRDSRRGSAGGQQKPAARARTSSRNRQRRSSGPGAPAPHPPHTQHAQHTQHTPHAQHAPHAAQSAPQQQQHHHHQPAGQGYGRGGWRGRARGRGRGFVPRNKNTLKFDNDYDFEQANTEFEELRSQLAKTKISDGEAKTEGEVDKKDDSGNETGAGEAELEEEAAAFTGYDKNKSFFDNISCEAVERSKGRSQRTDWRTERKLNSETFGVALARRGAWRGRGLWRHHNQHNQHHQPWRPMRGGGNTGGNRGGRGGPHPGPRPQQRGPANQPQAQAQQAPPQPPAQPQPATAAAK